MVIASTCAVLAGCTGKGVGNALPRAVGGGAGAQTTEQLRIVIPPSAGAATASSVRRPKYVSPSTQSISVAVDGGGAAFTNLGPTSPACQSAGALDPLTCTVAIAAAPGSHTVTLVTYDQPQASLPASPPAGTALSSNTVAITVVQGQDNVFPMTLAGVPKSILVAAAPTETTANGGNTSLVLAGPLPKTILAEALDADGNVIVGPGAPTITVTDPANKVSAANVPVTGNPSQASNAFTFTPLALGTTTLTVTATQTLASGAPAVATASVPTRLTQILAVSNSNAGTVTEYAPWSTVPALTINTGSASSPWALAVDTSGTLYVANWGAGTVGEYPLGGTTAARTITGLANPVALAFDAGRNLYIANIGGPNVIVYAAQSTTPLRTITQGLSNPYTLALDASGTLYVADANGNYVTTYASGTTTVASTITSGISKPWALAVAANGSLYVANDGNNTVTTYAAGSTTPAATIANGIDAPQALAFDANGTLYVANGPDGTVTTYAPGATTPSATLSTGASPYALAFDADGNLYVAMLGSNTVAVYAGGAILTRTISSGINAPLGLALIGP